MKSIIRLVMIIVLTINSILGYGASTQIAVGESDNTNLHFKEETKGDNKKDGPRMPSFAPVVGCLYNDMITVSCILEGEATVELLDANGISIFNIAVSDLRNELSFPVVVNDVTAVSVKVRVNDRSYIASLVL